VSTSSITGTAVRDLAATITRHLDADNDGKLSTTEFEGFLTQFLGVLQQQQQNTTRPAATTIFSLDTVEKAKVGTMAGFDATKLANASHDTTKYQVGRILQYYPNTPAGLKEALPEIQKIAPNATIVGTKGDKIDFGDYTDKKGERIGVIDVLLAAGLGGSAWQWQVVKE
jgi:hypothetical protein